MYRTISFVFVSIFTLALILFFACRDSKQKVSVLTGYAQGSLVDYYLIVNEDSTYQLFNYERINGNWRMHNDSMFLFKGDIVCAKLYNNFLVEYYCDEYKVLEIMTFKEIIPSKVVEIPVR